MSAAGWSSVPSTIWPKEPPDRELRLVDGVAGRIAFELDLDGEGQAVVGFQLALEEDFAVRPLVDAAFHSPASQSR